MQDHFFHRESAEIVEVIDDVARRHAGRERVFDDWLTMIVCCLAGGSREDEYLHTIQPYIAGEKCRRDIDKLAPLFGKLVAIMEETRSDILGDIFQGAITRGQAGQFFTPDSLCELMARLTDADSFSDPSTIGALPTDAAYAVSAIGKTVFDPCCGSGRLLLAAARENRNRFFVGQDTDHRCVKITAINLALWNLYGKVIWGNSLTLDVKRVYHTGFDGRSVIRVEEVPQAENAKTPRELEMSQGSLFD